MKANLKLGIKKKIMIVLAGSLVLTTALHVLLASYFTDQQNQEAAFVGLERDLFAWRNELQLMMPDLMARVNAGRGAGRIKTIRWL